MTKPVEPAFSNIILREFIQHNKHASIQIEENGTLLIEKPWGLDDARLKLSVNDHHFISDLNNLVFNPRFDAIFHRDTNEFEFIFAFLRTDDKVASEYKDRVFSFYFEGREYSCRFAEPTPRLMRMATYFEGNLPSDSTGKSIPQIKAFKDSQRLEKLPDRAKSYFAERDPRNFFVSSSTGFEGVNLEIFARHLNFLIRYYDRKAPEIVVKEVSSEFSASAKPVRLIESAFPSVLVVPRQMDDIVLRLIEVASNSASRISYLYYYQVFEYAGYYYIDEKARLALRNALRDPALICGGEDKVSELFTIFTDLTHNDEVKMRKVIEEYCDPKVIWREIKNNIEFFSSPQSFDGGFISQALVSGDTTEASWCSMWMPKTYDALTKIRNVLVHAREKRESKVILPSARNNQILSGYIPLIARIAEQLALKA